MSLVRVKNETSDMQKLTTKASTAITAGAAVSFDANGFLVHSTTSGTGYPVGVALESKAVGDATTTPILVDIIHANDVWEADFSSGTITLASLGDFIDISTAGNFTTTNSNNDAIIVDWNGKDTTKARIRFLRSLYA